MGTGGKRLAPPSGRRQTNTAERATGASRPSRRHASIANSESQMRSTKTRSRGSKNRNTRPSGGNIINRVFESSGPEGKVRGTPQQVIEKYLQLHRDAQLSGDRVNAENFAQHAEHYTRMLAEATREVERAREEQEEANRRRQAERDRARAEREARADTPSDGDESDSGLVDLPEGKPAFLDARSRGEGRRSRSPRSGTAPAESTTEDVNADPAPAPDKPARAPRAPRTRKPRSSSKSDSSPADGDAPDDVILPDIAS